MALPWLGRDFREPGADCFGIHLRFGWLGSVTTQKARKGSAGPPDEPY
ncbi:MAG: hypothetical protein QOE39_3717 [Bradyrhizobium sp.]|jgi:hypothetical protein|nr:hypothetical protein [Bradyrhizobium sp.]